MKKSIIMLLVKLRWLYFHLNPMYVKFYVANDEAHFQHRKAGSIHSNLNWVD